MDYPLPAYNYQVVIGGETMAFSEVSGLTIEYDSYVYKHGRSFKTGSKRLLSGQSTVRLSMKRGIFKGGQIGRFYQWIGNLEKDRVSMADAQITLCDENGEPVVVWNATGCIPVKLEVGTLSAEQNQPSISTLELIATKLKLQDDEASENPIKTEQSPRTSFPEVHQGYRFRVDFLGVAAAEGLVNVTTGNDTVPNIDSAFQSVSGLGSEITLETVSEGGQNVYNHNLPTKIQHGNLVLTRGLVNVSLINLSFEAAMTALTVCPTLVTVIMLNDTGLPVSCWVFTQAYPVKWNTSDLEADKYNVAIDTMELAYGRMYRLPV